MLLGLIRAAWPAPLKGDLALNRPGWLLRLELPSNPEILCVVRSALMRLTEELGFPPAQCRGLTRAVDEALANVICHAYSGRQDQSIELMCRRLEAETGGEVRSGLEILLVDHGAGAKREQLCGRSLDDIRPGGLGLHFIQDAVDDMEYTSQATCNTLRLVKYLPTAASQPKPAKGE
jgi:serine/threonine-protein kinase RsbW